MFCAGQKALKPVYGSEHVCYSKITSLGGKHPERVELSSAAQGYYEELAVLGLDRDSSRGRGADFFLTGA